ncbi:hypothetical protein C6495_13550, partial [Candidatus Poribacteria bacterium]
FEYYVDGLVQTLGLSDDSEGIKKLSRQENGAHYDDFIKAVQSKFAQLGRENVNAVINQLLKDVANLDARRKLSEFYGAFLDEVYPDGGVAPPKTTEDLIEKHFNAGQQTHAELDPIGGNTANTNTTAEGYEEDFSEEAEYDSAVSAETESENVQEYAAAERGTTRDSTAEDESVWAEGEPAEESVQTAEPPEAVADDESPSEPPPESAQESKTPPKRFSVADVDLKRLK